MSTVILRREQVRARRRIMMRIGFVVIVLASATACIFDKSDYQGGGRLDKGATAKTAEPTPTQSGSTQPTNTTTAPTANPLLDAGEGG